MEDLAQSRRVEAVVSKQRKSSFRDGPYAADTSRAAFTDLFRQSVVLPFESCAWLYIDEKPC